MAPPLTEMVGRTFNRLTVLKEVEPNYGKGGSISRRFLCRCDCGNLHTTFGAHLRSGQVKSCGCLRKELVAERSIKHGEARNGKETVEYRTWMRMLSRCYYERDASYQNYGGRGISVCERWRFGNNFKTGYECFLLDVGRRPFDSNSIDRIDNDGNYEPGNIRWATGSEQQHNKRGKLQISVNGKMVPLAKAARDRGIPYQTAVSRFRAGLTVNEILSIVPLPYTGSQQPR